MCDDCGQMIQMRKKDGVPLVLIAKGTWVLFKAFCFSGFLCLLLTCVRLERWDLFPPYTKFAMFFLDKSHILTNHLGQNLRFFSWESFPPLYIAFQVYSAVLKAERYFK